jgi:hypothetical protein
MARFLVMDGGRDTSADVLLPNRLALTPGRATLRPALRTRTIPDAAR